MCKFCRSYSELLSKFGAISFQEYVSKGNTHPLFYGDFLYKLRRVKGEANFISSGSKIVKRRASRGLTIGLVLGPFTAFCISFLKRCTLTKKTWRALSSEATGSWSLVHVIVSQDSFGLWTWARVHTARRTAFFNGCPYILLYTIILLYLLVYHIFMTFSALVGCWSSVSMERIIYKFLNVCPFDYPAIAFSEKVNRS